MKTRKKGYYRDSEVKRSIEIFEILSTEQIYVLHFNNIKNIDYGLNKVRERMRKTKGVKKKRLDFKLPTFYFYKIKMSNAIHDVNRNWGFLYLIKLYQDKYKFNDLKIEYVIEDMQSDGFIELVRYIDDKDKIYYFVESDISDSNNKFEKIKKHNDLFKRNGYIHEDWVKSSKHYPHILIVTDNNKKKDKIIELIEIENTENLMFIVITVDEIRAKLL